MMNLAAWTRQLVQMIESALGLHLDATENVDGILSGARQSASKHRSLLFFTTHGCASTFVGSLLGTLAARHGILPADFAAFEYSRGQGAIESRLSPPLRQFLLGQQPVLNQHNLRELDRVVSPHGHYFGPIRMNRSAGAPLTSRMFMNLPNLDRFKLLLMLRDPRDVLSASYRLATDEYNVDSNQGVTDQSSCDPVRPAVVYQGIDDHVLSAAESRLTVYRDCCERLLGREDVLFVKYEQMIEDFDSWLDQVLAFWELPADTRWVRRIRGNVNLSASDESTVRPGDHARRLRPETVDALNKQFADILQRLGYPEVQRHSSRAA